MAFRSCSYIVSRYQLLKRVLSLRPPKPQGLGLVDKARYSEAIIQMDAIATELNSLYLERGDFPGDRFANQQPVGIHYFPLQGPIVPFNSRYDYESGNGGSSRYYIQISVLGKDWDA